MRVGRRGVGWKVNGEEKREGSEGGKRGGKAAGKALGEGSGQCEAGSGLGWGEAAGRRDRSGWAERCRKLEEEKETPSARHHGVGAGDDE